VPTVCILEDIDSGLRWLVADGRVTEETLRIATENGVVGWVRSNPLRYLPALVASDSASYGLDGTVHVDDTSPFLRWVEVHHLPAVVLAQAVPVRQERFVHIHAHSEFSPLDGLSTIEEMVTAVAEMNQGALALTDHGHCAGHPQLQQVCKKAGIKPIFGVEAYLVNNRHDRTDRHGYNHFLLLAKNEVGLRNLWGASSEAHLQGKYGHPRMDYDTLERFSEGVIASTACIRGPLSKLILNGDEEGAKQLLSRLLAIYGENLYLELHTNHIEKWQEKKYNGEVVQEWISQPQINEGLVALGKEMGVPLIVVCDSHYASCDDHQLHQVWIASQTDKDLTEEGDLFGNPGEHYHLQSADEVAQAIAYLGDSVVSEAMANTVAIANMVDVEIRQRMATPVYHRKPLPGQDIIAYGPERDIEVLRDLCAKGWAEKVAWKTQDEIDGADGREGYQARLDRELKVLIEKGFAGYFLIVWDYCLFARENKILMGPGRGSVVGSLVAYLLGITAVDPIEADLMFERFITQGRMSPPDIDLDFPSSRRDDVTNYIVERWGADRVVRVGTHLRLKNKGVVNSMSKVLGKSMEIDFMDIKAIAKIIDDAESGTAGAGLKWDELWDQEGELLDPYRAKYPVMFSYADRLVKRLKSYSRHASGVVIDPENPIIDRLPLRIAENQDGSSQITTEYDYDALEFLGYLKFDILTLRTLDTIQMCLDMVREDPVTGVEIDISTWTDEYEDPQVWDMLCEGDTLGVFQIETGEGTKLVRRMQPRNIADLSAILTLVRPGPMRSGLTETYLKRRFGKEEVVFPHQKLESVLNRTYGAMIYQEDIMAVCSTLAGYDLEEADKVRAILGKKKVEEAQKEGKRFVQRAIDNGVSAEVAQLLWGQMEEFAKYTFNRAHAWSYAVLGYWCAWLKCHFPVHFLVAVLSTVDKNRIPEFVELARRNGYSVLPPDVNDSAYGFSVSGDRIGVRYGFSSIGSIGDSASAAIISGQPYSSFDDFIERRGPKCNFGHIKTLAALGTFDSLLPPNRHRAELEILIAKLADGKNETCQWKDVPGASMPMLHQTHGEVLCGFDWASEVKLGKSGKPLKPRPLPKTCSKACRNYTPTTGLQWPDGITALTAKQIRDREREMLGVYLSSTPFDVVSLEMLDQEGVLYGRTAEEFARGDGYLYGIIQRVRKHTDRSDRQMAFMTVNTLGYDIDITVFSKTYEAFRNLLVPDTLGVFGFRRDDRGTTLIDMSTFNQN
jgi:DNA polymerase-3 subunit alpha